MQVRQLLWEIIVDTRIYLDINHFARNTPWAHGVASVYAIYGGAVILGLLLIVAWWRARSSGQFSERVPATIWAGAATIIAVGVAQPINNFVARIRPYYTLHHVELLVPKAHDYTFPSDHATVAGAVICGLWLSRDRLLAWSATVIGLLLAFDRVYVGAHYPGDVLGGLCLGAVVVLVLRPPGLAILRPLAKWAASSPLWFFVAPSSQRNLREHTPESTEGNVVAPQPSSETPLVS
ncbi:MAG: phosphatase PAP2 family protein [Acidimicrobiales bacterium]